MRSTALPSQVRVDQAGSISLCDDDLPAGMIVPAHLEIDHFAAWMIAALRVERETFCCRNSRSAALEDGAADDPRDWASGRKPPSRHLQVQFAFCKTPNCKAV